MTDRELMQMTLDALETRGEHHPRVYEAIKVLRDRLAQPEPTGREIQKMMQSAWKAVSNQYKDDPECCFALGWEAGYGAVAPRVEPPETESGGGFKSPPAPSIKQPEPVAWWDGKESVMFAHDKISTPNWTDYWTKPLYADPTPCKTCEALARTVMMDQTSHDVTSKSIETAVLAEREACAEICDGISEWYETRTDLNQTQKQVGQLAAEVCGVRIRERGEK